MTTTNDVVQQLTDRNVFSRDEVVTLLRAVFADRDSDVLVFADQLYAWAETVRRQSLVLDMILKGALSVTFNKDGEMVAGLTELASELKKALEAGK